MSVSDSGGAACRPVLGDRTFKRNQWGGSVLDSVVGAFLTQVALGVPVQACRQHSDLHVLQNVTDALSSKAFLSLAASFPVSRSTASAPGDCLWVASHVPLASRTCYVRPCTTQIRLLHT